MNFAESSMLPPVAPTAWLIAAIAAYVNAAGEPGSRPNFGRKAWTNFRFRGVSIVY